MKVHCQGETGALLDVGPELGTVQFDAAGHPADRTDLKHQVCGWLAKLPGGIVAHAATAVEVLAHESYHLAGYTDEATAECYALQTMPFVAEQFDATPAQIAHLDRLLVRALPVAAGGVRLARLRPRRQARPRLAVEHLAAHLASARLERDLEARRARLRGERPSAIFVEVMPLDDDRPVVAGRPSRSRR